MADVIVLEAFRFARAFGLDAEQARRVAEPHEGEPYTPDVAVERVAAEFARWEGEVRRG